MTESDQTGDSNKAGKPKPGLPSELTGLSNINETVRTDSVEIFSHLLQRKVLTSFQKSTIIELGITEDGIPLAAKLAAVDVFSEKAILHLTKRGYFSYFVGFAFSFLTGLVSYWFYESVKGAQLIPVANSKDLVLPVLGKLAISAVFLSGIYFSASLARAFFHEATVLFNRRHSIRFGRVHVYLKDGDMRHDELMDAFGWNFEPKSAFMKIRPELVTKSLPGQIIEAVRTGAEIVTNVSKATKSGSVDLGAGRDEKQRDA